MGCSVATLVVALMISCWQLSDAYLPVIILHGIFASSKDMESLEAMVKKAHPGTVVYNIDGFDDVVSVLQPMWKQVDSFKQKMMPIFENSTDGVNMICFSQGGLACRAILETTPHHNVKTFISLSSPQGGQYGDTVYLKYFWPNMTKEHIYVFFYTDLGQETSFGNYWKDPHHYDEYLKSCKFLPLLDNPSTSSYRDNFLELEKLVLIGGPDDGVITPWQSSHFAFFDADEEVVELEKQEYFLNDSFGLRTLNSSGKLHTHIVPGVEHVHWHTTQSVFDCCMEPYLH